MIQKQEIAVRIRSVSKSFGKGEQQVKVLRNVELDVRTGELLMLVGPSGCGKTTLISVMAGTLTPDDGEAQIFGHDLMTIGEDERVRFRADHVGFVFQSFNLIPTLTVAENVSVPLVIQGMKPAHAEQRAREVLERVGLGNRADAAPSQLSGGQQQRVAIARALVHKPKLVVCDEPTSALDHENGKRVMEILQKLAAEDGTTLVIVTHDSRVFHYADRIAQMDDGRIAHIADRSEAAVMNEVAA